MRTKIILLIPLFLLTLAWVFSFNPPTTFFSIKNIFPYDFQRLLQLLSLILIAIFGMSASDVRNGIVEQISSWRTSTIIALVLFFWIGLISCLFAKAPGYAFLEWSLFILLTFFALCWTAIAVKMGERFYYLFSGVIAIIAASYIYPVCRDYLYTLSHHQPLNLFPYFIDKRFFTQFAVFTIGFLPLLDNWFQQRAFTWLRIPLFVLNAFWWALMLINGSRGLILGFIIAIMTAAIIYKKAIWPWLWRQCCFIGIAVASMLLLIIAISLSHAHNIVLKNVAHLSHFNTNTFGPRILLYSYTIQLIMHHPLLGVGPMHFAYAPPLILAIHKQLVAHPHNFILLIFSEWGIPAGTAFLFIVLYSLILFIRKNKIIAKEASPEKNIIYISCLISVIAGLCDAMVSGVFVMPLAQTILAVTIGCAMALCTPKYADILDQQKNIKNKWIILPILMFVLIFSIYIITATLIETLPNLFQSEIHWLLSQPKGLHTPFNPRFWLQGWIHQ